MIDLITQYIARIAGTALISGAIISMAGKGASASVCKLAGALLIISTVVTPIRSIRWNFADFFNDANIRLENRVKDTENKYKELTESVISAKLENYAEEEAQKRGIDIKIKITAYTDEKNVFHAETATVWYADYKDFTHKAEVEKILTEECGISEESQKHLYEH